VSYKVAAEMGGHYLRVLDEFSSYIAPGVTANLYNLHIRPIFGVLVGKKAARE
jgi:hypothetical protein